MRRSDSLARRKPSRQPKSRFLVVCEGKVTEKCYLEQLSAADAQKELDALMAKSIPDNAKDRQIQVDRLNRDRQCARQKVALARSHKGI